MTNAKFKAQLAAFEKRAFTNLDQVVRKIALEVLSALVLKSPVDTGRFRGNWFVQVAPAPAERDVEDKSGGVSLSEGGEQIAQFQIGGRLYVMNHLPYAQALEYGHSQQAPQGMVRITAAEFQQYVDAIMAKVKM